MGQRMSSKEIFVSIALGTENYWVGRLWCHHRKGRESASFEYDENWLKHPECFALEPALALTSGAFHTLPVQSLFGAIGDSAPDRWGRVLMRRAENQRAKDASDTPRALGEVDFLLGVYDEARQGALRFSRKREGPFLSVTPRKSIPLLIGLPKLLSATEHFLDDKESAEDLKILLAPGSSLGGARPKASVRDHEGKLAIAKFPHKDDDCNIVVWEAVALALAQKSGLHVPTWRLETILDKAVLLIQRFDRVGQTRIPFLSAMSLLGANDHEAHSYLEIVDALKQYGGKPDVDMSELWRRIVFSILISNTDDHLRNHGFLYERQQGWRLSPAYDMNPTPTSVKPRILTTSIDLYDGTASLDLALSVASDFRVSKKDAQSIIKEVVQGVSQWRDVAGNFGLKKREIEGMASAFEHEDSKKARKM